MNPILSLVIVTYNHAAEIGACLDSVQHHSTLRPLEIFIIDNASRDDTLAAIAAHRQTLNSAGITVTAISNAQNYGFTRAVNQGLNRAQGKFILLLNPDTEITSHSLEQLVQFLGNHPDVGAVAPQLLFPDGRFQPSCRRFPRYRYLLFEVLGFNRLFPNSAVFNGWKMGDFNHRSQRAVDQPQGACLLFSRNLLQEIGNLDERFWLFFSDVDYCRRIWKSGKKIIFYPAVQVVHHQGSAVYANRIGTIWISHLDFVRYFLKWYRTPAGWLWNVVGLPFLLIVGAVRWSVQQARKMFAKK